MIIEKLLAEDWEPGADGAEGRQVPAMVRDDDCVVGLNVLTQSFWWALKLIVPQDCFNWEYGDFKD